jgi:electron transport complex protein RnfB
VVSEPEVKPNLCFPGKSAVAEAVAEITGKKVAAGEERVAAIRCSKVEGKVAEKYRYTGYISCAGSNLAFGGPQGCVFACIGFGDCADACPFGAIHMENGFPLVDAAACVGCGSCVRACPKKVIDLIPRNARVWVPCSTKDPGKKVKDTCEVGCISCQMCIKACPARAVEQGENMARDHSRCIAYGPACGEVCVEKCPRKIFRRYVPGEKGATQPLAASG